MRTRECPIPNELHGVVVSIAEALSRPCRDNMTTCTSLKSGPPASPTGDRVARNWLDRLDDWIWQRRQPDQKTFLEWSNYVADLDRLLRGSSSTRP
ncbi:MAG TPA: hypothetical protein PLW68_08340 [Casimicrobiaceae bacterium]|nr:hypothetical protein [Casimicrobiaceae bacterium]